MDIEEIRRTVGILNLILRFGEVFPQRTKKIKNKKQKKLEIGKIKSYITRLTRNFITY